MATIKAGTYRFNDVLVGRLPSSNPEFSDNPAHEYFDFTTEYMSSVVDCIGFYLDPYDGNVTRMDYYLSESISSMHGIDNATVYVNGVWNYQVFGESVQTITIPNDTEVSAEFLTWFTANTNEVKAGATIKGTWQFNEVITGITSEEYNEVMLTLICGKKIRSVNRMRVGGTPNEPDIQCRYVNADGNVGHFHIYDSRGWLMGKDRLVTFVGEQTVSADFYDWFTSNAVAVNDKIGEVKHQGNTIAAIYPGRSTVIKCAGMNMASDVVVSVAEQEATVPVLQEKTATENGEVTPDAGYDGLSKVTVAVEVAAVEDYDGTITIV